MSVERWMRQEKQQRAKKKQKHRLSDIFAGAICPLRAFHETESNEGDMVHTSTSTIDCEGVDP
jgi:hypothetical protein